MNKIKNCPNFHLSIPPKFVVGISSNFLRASISENAIKFGGYFKANIQKKHGP